jgi:translin
MKQKLDTIADRIHTSFDLRTAARDRTLTQARALIRHCANEEEATRAELEAANVLASSLKENLTEYPDLYFAGYTQDALKEFAEAYIFHSLIQNLDFPSPEDLDLEYATYLQGLAEAAGELRRRCLDILRHGHSQEAERLLSHMDDIYAILVTMDYPDAITGGLRRLTDIVRNINEKTRGDMTLSLRQEHLEQSLQRMEQRLDH